MPNKRVRIQKTQTDMKRIIIIFCSIFLVSIFTNNTTSASNPTVTSSSEHAYFVRDITDYLQIDEETGNYVSSRESRNPRPFKLYSKDNHYHININGGWDIMWLVYNNNKSSFMGYNVSRYRFVGIINSRYFVFFN